ncbi:DNA ligase [Vibrio phage vB_VcorM_GR7B]|nr:DNA ligase [Vibrio phage vB_VcorM_GR7B]
MSKDIKKILKQPEKFVASLSLKKLEEYVREFKHAYYSTSKTLVPDHVYDIFEDALRERKPDSSALAVGTSDDKAEKEELPFYMGSMDKVKTQKALDLYAKKYPGPWRASDKEDGVSIGLERTGKKISAYKRSSGAEGHNISRLIPHISGMGKLPDGWQIRGELEIADAVYTSHFSDDYNDPRGAVVGLTNPMRKDIHPLTKHVTLIAYEIVRPRMKPSKQFKELEKRGFITPKHKKFTELDEDTLYEYLMKRRKKSAFALDGIILTQDQVHPINKSGNPEWSVAFKAHDPDAIKQVKVLEVEWNQSRYGYLIPRIIIEETELSGVMVNHATGHNAKYILDNKIGKGSTIEVIRSGDVIPYVMSVIKGNKKADMPDLDYTWTTNEDGEEVHIVSTSKTDVQIIKELTHFISTMGVEGIKHGTLAKLVEEGYSNIFKFLKIKESNLIKIDGFGTSKVKDVRRAIEELKHGDIVDYMVASALFGRGMGDTKLRDAVLCLGDPMELSPKDTELVERLKANGGWNKTAQTFVDGLKPFQKFMKKLIKSGIEYHMPEEPEEVEVNEDGCMSGQHVTLTSFRNPELVEWITQEGGTVGNLSGKTTMLVYKDGATNKKIDGFSGDKFTLTEFTKEYNPTI